MLFSCDIVVRGSVALVLFWVFVELVERGVSFYDLQVPV